MNTRIGFLKLATFVSVAAAALAPATAHAQTKTAVSWSRLSSS